MSEAAPHGPSLENSLNGPPSYSSVRSSGRALSRRHNSNTATVNALATFQHKEPREFNPGDSKDGPGPSLSSSSSSQHHLPFGAEAVCASHDGLDSPSPSPSSSSTLAMGKPSSAWVWPRTQDERLSWSEGADRRNQTLSSESSHSLLNQGMLGNSRMSMHSRAPSDGSNSLLNQGMIAYSLMSSMPSLRSLSRDADGEGEGEGCSDGEGEKKQPHTSHSIFEDFGESEVLEPVKEGVRVIATGEHDSFTESVILEGDVLQSMESESPFVGRKNDTFDAFMDELRLNESDCSFGSLVLENLSSCIDALVATTDPRTAATHAEESGEDGVVLHASSDMCSDEPSHGPHPNESSSSSSSAEAKASESRGSLSPPQSLSQSVDYQPLRAAVPVQRPPLNASPIANYLDFEGQSLLAPLPHSQGLARPRLVGGSGGAGSFPVPEVLIHSPGAPLVSSRRYH